MKGATKKLYSGSIDFTTAMGSGVPSWTVIAVETSLERALRTFLAIEPPRQIHRNVPQVIAKQGDQIGLLIPIVKLSATKWTVIFRSIHSSPSRSLREISTYCQEISRNLKTRTLVFVGEETLFYCGYELFQSGKLVERAGWEINSIECNDFKSSRRPLPVREIYDLSFADETLRDIGIYIPVCYGKSTRHGFALAVTNVSKGAIEKAHLVELLKW